MLWIHTLGNHPNERILYSWEIFEKYSKYQISWKCVLWEPSCSITFKQEDNSRFSQFFGCALNTWTPSWRVLEIVMWEKRGPYSVPRTLHGCCEALSLHRTGPSLSWGQAMQHVCYVKALAKITMIFKKTVIFSQPTSLFQSDVN